MSRGPDRIKTLHAWDSLPEIFEAQAARTPEAIALEFGQQKISYQELDRISTLLAQKILQQAPQKEEIIAIASNRSPEMIIGILAIMKAGCAYLPLDPNLPSKRLSFILKDSGARMLLTQSPLVSRFEKHFSGTIVLLDEPLDEKPEKPSLPKLSQEQLAYMIYTSGSTGKPKGVLIEHRSVINMVLQDINVFDLDIRRFLYAYSFSFDGAVQLIWVTLCAGGSLVIAPEDLEKDLTELSQFVQEKEINHLLTFPSLYSLLLDGVGAEKMSSLISVSVAGEVCPGSLVKKHFEVLPAVRFLNQYGPTEATVGTTIFEAPRTFEGTKTPIGKCIPNTEIYILGEDDAILPDGQVGEIGISGSGLARGYHNREELTNQKFFKHPELEGKRIYRTGDLGKYLPDGNLDFMGRLDHQIKLRGYRIELGEIENTLKSLSDIQEAVVSVVGENEKDKKLVAFVSLSVQGNTNIEVWKKQLEDQLPGYMIPARFELVKEFSFAPTGKIDRKALPKISIDRPDLSNELSPPRTELERFLCQLWEEALDVRPVGIHDKFFELGGNSLQAAALISKLQSLLRENIFIVTLFEHPTVAQFAAMLARDYEEAVQKNFEQTKGTLSTGSSTSVLSSAEIKAFLQGVPSRAFAPAKTDPNPSAIFILAPPRSGTSLLRLMLNGHSGIFAANELQLLHFQNMGERAKAYTGKFALWKEGLVRAVMELRSCKAESAQEIIQDWEQQSLSTKEIFEILQNWSPAKYLLDKSPSYALDYEALLAATSEFENPKFIQISRNPYAMVDSFDRMHMDQVMYLPDNNYQGAKLGEQIWYHSHSNIQKFFEGLPADQKISVRYEDLVKNPGSKIESILSFLDLPFEGACLKPYEDIESKMVDGIHQGSKPMGDVNLLKYGKIQSQLADKWKGASQHISLHSATIRMAEKLGHETLLSSKNFKKGKYSEEDIAIVGMQVRLPGANNLEEFWENLKLGRDVSKLFSDKEMRAAGVDEMLFSKAEYVRRGMVLEDHDKFDASFFGFLPKEAALMDPQHRIFLEVAYHALEEANLDPETYRGRVGIIGAIARNTYLVNHVMAHPNYFESLDDFQIGIALEKDFPATRVAYKLNLRGPALSVQTACSSSGVAIHLACQSLRAGDAEVMLVGGGRIQPPVEAGYLHTDGHALSPTGYCHTFDANANGMVRGQGMLCIVLKKLSKALEDGDQIRAVIKGSAINNDGADKVGFTAPSAKGQAKVIEQALNNAGISASDLGYIQAHGTGTRLGDPIE
ncbi:MAG: amino acid adenylation domain-containing protein, partial [Saprospiraceae bacterium]|nr:amino acid adenylation domain-containing protein [Saprospiraceae bacterium]